MTIYIKSRETEDILGVYEDRKIAFEDLREKGIGVNTVEVCDLEDEDDRDAIEIQLDHDDRVQADHRDEPDLYVAYASLTGDDVTDLHTWVDEADEAYYGSFSSDGEFAEDVAENIVGSISSDWPYNHIDWDAAADDILSGDYSAEDGYYFRNN